MFTLSFLFRNFSTLCLYSDTLWYTNQVFFFMNAKFVKDIFLHILCRFWMHCSLKFLLNFVFYNFWLLIFNKSYCLVLSYANLEFARYFFAKVDLDHVKVTFLCSIFIIGFCLPLMYFIWEDLDFLFPVTVNNDFYITCLITVPLNFFSLLADFFSIYFLVNAKFLFCFL